MNVNLIEHEVYSLLAELFEYPTAKYKNIASRCRIEIEKQFPNILAEFMEFFETIQKYDADQLEQMYTDIFEINPTCAPYAGYHIFGESYIRSLFLAGLNERYKSYNFSSGKELPDHVSVILRFLSNHQDTELGHDLIADALIPMIDRIIWSSIRPEDKPENPELSYAYYKLFRSLKEILVQHLGFDDNLSRDNQKFDPLPLFVFQDKNRPQNGIDQWINKRGK